MEKRDYYEVLQVSRDADGNTIKKSYRKLAVQYHPDKNPDDSTAEEKFKELGEAYEVLMDDQKRAAYDRYGHRAFSQGTGASAGGGFGGDPFDIFREVFKGGGGGAGGSIFEEFFGGGGAGRAERRKRGSDLRYDLQITLEEVETGVEKELKIERLVECESCEGSGADGGRADVRTCTTCGGVGQVITSRGFFQVQQTCPDCGGGGESISNPCHQCDGEGRVDGSSRIKLKIPAGMIDSGRLRSVGHGDAGMKGGSAGDLYVVVHVKKHEIFERDESDLFAKSLCLSLWPHLGGSFLFRLWGARPPPRFPQGRKPTPRFVSGRRVYPVSKRPVGGISS